MTAAKKRIIITQRSFSVLEGEESFLNRSNIGLVAVGSKEEILDLHAREKADLIVIDHEAPAMSTEEFCSTVRDDERLRKVSIIVVGSGEESSFDVDRPPPANAVVPWPVDTPLFFDLAHRLLHVSPRVALRTPLGVRFEGSQRDESFLCYGNDISVSGMLFDSERLLRKGDVLECGFLLPDGTQIRAEAEVMRVVKKGRDYDSYKYGVRFVNLGQDAAWAIEDYVNRASRQNR